MNKVNGLPMWAAFTASFGLIHLFTIPAMQAGANLNRYFSIGSCLPVWQWEGFY